ncbi:MAG: response regulator [Candidatus Eisenbacteria bacterium]|uniref:Response regulator n=1 Tax=Eiseniibacteriota bacterium TaxID=2212470 RepID=A0A933SDD9_UNCEI|nr:response regulator [Candidatus Eisenbacteria bacterium]
MSAPPGSNSPGNGLAPEIAAAIARMREVLDQFDHAHAEEPAASAVARAAHALVRALEAGAGTAEPASALSGTPADVKGFAPRALLRALLAEFAPVARERRLTLTTTLHPSLPREYAGDAKAFLASLRAAVADALARTHEGGIAVRLLPSRGHENGLRAEVHEPSHEFESGRGGEPAQAPRAAGDGAYTRDADGSWIRAIEFMPSTEDSAAGKSAKPTADGALHGMRVLVVEDTKVLRLIAQRQLEQLGATVAVAEDGMQALSLVAARRFDLVLMDCHMPRLDGFETTRSIRRRGGPERDVVIFALTAANEAEDVRRCTEAGMNAVLQKPIDLDALAHALAVWMPMRSEKVEPGAAA